MTTERIMNILRSRYHRCPSTECVGAITCVQCYEYAVEEVKRKLNNYDELQRKLANFKANITVQLDEL